MSYSSFLPLEVPQTLWKSRSKQLLVFKPDPVTRLSFASFVMPEALRCPHLCCFTELLCYSGFFDATFKAQGTKRPTFFATSIVTHVVLVMRDQLHKLLSKFTKYPASLAFATLLIATPLWSKQHILMLALFIFTTRQDCKHCESSTASCIQQLSTSKLNFHCFV